jgi:hypothetical protein
MSFIKAADLGKKVLDDYNAAMEAKAMQEKAYYEKMVAQREDMRPQQLGSATPTSPIRNAVELLDLRITQLQAVTERMFSALRPVTTNTDDSLPVETRATKQGNSPLNIDLNATADRLEIITAALQLQIDQLEV